MGSQQVIKLLVRSFRRLRLFFCGLLTRPTAPRHAPQTAKFPSNPESAPEVECAYYQNCSYCLVLHNHMVKFNAVRSSSRGLFGVASRDLWPYHACRASSYPWQPRFLF
ncbi:hypothetical protein Vspart_00883 [Vibrio spartinae]|nr:hypothetical protein Vspart_00883 [Vibrio spartinae]SIO95699.1 hypothetical protein VSP9026_03450 [Vibrio spartinae]